MKPTAAISIDVDSLSSIYKGKGCTNPDGYTYAEFRQGMDTIFNFFYSFNIRVTLFLVGTDLLHEENRPFVKVAHQAGHELANHSYNHPQGFRWLRFGHLCVLSRLGDSWTNQQDDRCECDGQAPSLPEQCDTGPGCFLLHLIAFLALACISGYRLSPRHKWSPSYWVCLSMSYPTGQLPGSSKQASLLAFLGP